MSEPLLEKNPFNAKLQQAEFKAYCRYWELEARGSSEPPPKIGVTKQVAARILGYMLIYALSRKGRIAIAEDISDCETNDRLCELGSMFKDFILLRRFNDI
ncbi:hypothetical protein OBBRIDRAFT_795084 [Obba rivulosa]|uniref:Uncharacterized protein n=1 Tax=Obba rivulosa TaxID=1052685 RepID=A0A8E2DK86_9APHY|nr:hypothetical protein OBBRIDRAFT_795084 [Obba rivulosa]